MPAGEERAALRGHRLSGDPSQAGLAPGTSEGADKREKAILSRKKDPGGDYFSWPAMVKGARIGRRKGPPSQHPTLG